MSINCTENCIEWLTGDKEILCTFSQKKYINRIYRMAEKYPSVKILAENQDGSILAKLPSSAIHLTIYDKPNMNTFNGFKKKEEQKNE